MGELLKPWSNGGSLSVSYDGDGDGTAVFSSSPNTGEEREMEVSFADASRNVIIVRRVRQAAGQGSAETYTRLTFIESTGAQYINTGYVVQEDDVIEMTFIKPERTSASEYMFGANDTNGALWSYINSNSTYNRFGSGSNVTLSSTRWKNRIRIQRGAVDIEGTKGELPLDGMPQVPLYVFARNNNNVANGGCTIKTTGFTITKTSGETVMKLRPCKRDADGAVGMIDIISGSFFENMGSEAFAYGGEAKTSDDFEILDYLAFDDDKIFDTGVYGNERVSFEILFERTDTSGSDYLFGCSSGNRITGYLAQSGYWRYGSGAPTFNTKDMILHYAVVTAGKTQIDNTSKTFTVGSAFQTSFTIPVGGHKPASGVATPNFQGYLYFFRMMIDDEYVADLLPCKRLSDGVEGLWDCATQKFVEPV